MLSRLAPRAYATHPGKFNLRSLLKAIRAAVPAPVEFYSLPRVLLATKNRPPCLSGVWAGRAATATSGGPFPHCSFPQRFDTLSRTGDLGDPQAVVAIDDNHIASRHNLFTHQKFHRVVNLLGQLDY